MRAKRQLKINRIIERFSDRNPIKYKGSIFLALVFFYFAFHLVTGERGLLAYVRLKGEISEEQHKAEVARTEKLALAHRVVGLRGESLDLDLLEEVARKDLGYSHSDEVVVLDKQSKI